MSSRNDRPGSVEGVRLGVDVGGTFTDLVAIRGHEIWTAKVPSTPSDQSEGVMRSVEAAAIEGDTLGGVTTFAHGMTVATNALLERRGARTALITTEGFRDVLEIGRQNRPSLYDPTQDRPPALVPRDLRFTIRERVGRDGELTPIDSGTLQEALERVRNADVDAVAVCLLFSFLHPEHERRIGEALREALPDVHVSLSSDVLREFREYERFSTTVADAYLGPKLAAYFRNLADRTAQAKLPTPQVMQSSGGVMELEVAAERAARCILSGPAGGVVGAAFVASAGGYDDVLTFDMGGTSTDVAPVTGGEVQTTTEAIVAGVPIRFPMVDVHTVSAGGGSIAWVDAGRALRVGPHSAGADPGPAAYGKGGAEPAVTDANLYLGYLADEAELGGEVVLDRSLAEKALSSVAKQLDMDVLEVALGVVRVANAEMVRALRVISVERGLDPREFALVAFGGAGPIHACALAEELDIRTVLVPKVSGVLSALGLAISELRRDYVHPFFATLSEADSGALGSVFGELEGRAHKELDAPVCERSADLRYRGQSFELTVEAPDFDALEDRFHEAHEQRYGYRMDEEPVEIVTLRLVATVEGDEPELHEDERDDDPVIGKREANFDGEWAETAVLQRDLMGLGTSVEGPAIVEFTEATCVVRPGWAGEVDAVGTLVLTRAEAGA